jgi:NADPH:quinone reductase-like Zn-dependent oxidoreductase
MKAAVYTRFGPPGVLAIREVETPTPRDDDVLIKVHATTVTAAEADMRRGRPLWGRVVLGVVRPRKRMRTLGTEFAGEIAAVGKNATRFHVGDEVFGFTGFNIGANAEYLRIRESGSLCAKPANVGFEEAAAAVDGGSTALFFLRDKARLRPGDRVLVVGASGSIGTYAVQLARYLGAEVTGVCSTPNVELVESLGAHHVIDYTCEDFAQSSATYDVVFDTVGKSAFARSKAVLAPSGRYVATTGFINYFLAWATRFGSGKRVVTGMSVDKSAALPYLRSLIEAGELRIVIDRRFDLDEIVEAHRYVDSGRKRGNVVIRIVTA